MSEDGICVLTKLLTGLQQFLVDIHACITIQGARDTYLSRAELLNPEDSLSVNACTFPLLACIVGVACNSLQL